MKRISRIVTVGVVLVSIGCSMPRGAGHLMLERDSEPPRLPNFSREMQSPNANDSVRVEGFTQISTEMRR